MKESQILFFICFILYGVVNNLGYVVSLSAAKDILQNQIQTSVVLLCDVLPSIIVKIFVPYVQTVSFIIKIILTVILAILGFIFTALSYKSIGLGLFGVVLHSISSGIGEPIFLQYTTLFGKNAVSGWCIGTGLAGFIGSFLYAILTTVANCTPTEVLYSFIIFPVLMLLTMIITEYWLKNINKQKVDKKEVNQAIFSMDAIKQLKTIWIYLLALFLVYLSEYSINQGVDAVIDYPNTSYEGYYYTYSQFCYQLGVLISRSTLDCFVLPKKVIIIPSILQAIFLILFSFEAVYKFIDNFYIQLVLCVCEGLWGGLTYVGCIYWVGVESKIQYKQFNLSVAVLFDSIGIVLASVLGCILEPWFNDIKRW